MQQNPTRIDEVPRDEEVVVYCKVGGRSAQVQQFLQSHGYDRVRNLTGGVMAWKREVDPALIVA